MITRFKSFQVVSLVVMCLLVVGATGLASAHTGPLAANRPMQGTPSPTPINPEERVTLTFGKSSTSPIDNDQVSYRYFKVDGKANQLLKITVSRLAGNYGVNVSVTSQTGVRLGEADGAFLDSAAVTVKLPQDGNYTIYVTYSDPGAGDFQAGTFSILVEEAKPAATPTAAK